MQNTRVILKIILFNLLLLFIYSCGGIADKYDVYFVKNRQYVYSAVYIDEKNDTITREKMILAPRNKRWVAQPGEQESVYILYFTDTIGIKNYKSFDPSVKDFKFKKKENTGGYYNDEVFFLHSPRQNQYKILYYAAHPMMYFSRLTDSLKTMEISIQNLAKQVYVHKYSVKPDTILYDSITKKELQYWQVHIQTETKNMGPYFGKLGLDSKCDAIFSKEYGFSKMHYTFENGIKINFDLVEIKIW